MEIDTLVCLHHSLEMKQILLSFSHLINSYVRAVWCGRQVAAARDGVVRRLQIHLAFYNTVIVQLLLTSGDCKQSISLKQTIFE